MLTGFEAIKGAGCLKGATVKDFWSWAYSDILNNTSRGVFAEFMIATALGLADKARVEWDSVDLRYEGRGIEVKASAYLQSWYQAKLSKIRFNIAKKLAWNPETNEWGEKPERNADIYVFCVYTEKNKENIDVLNSDKWEFYVVSTTKLNEKLPDQKTIGQPGLRKLANPVRFDNLKEEIAKIIQP